MGVVSPTGQFVDYRTTIPGVTPQLVLKDTCVGALNCTPGAYAITDPATTYDVVNIGQISQSGRYVSYSAAMTGGTQQVYLHDTCIGASSCTPSDVLASTPDGTSAGDGDSADSLLSDDGRYVAFDSAATNLVAHDTNGARDVFWRDTCAGVVSGCISRTVRLTVDSSGVQAWGDHTVIQIRGDGQGGPIPQQ